MSWDKYVDANGVLRNLLGITDANRLSEAEADFTRRRIRELEVHPVQGEFDIAHLQAIHRYIAQDLVSWAGELRDVNIAKQQMFCPVGNLRSYADEIFRRLATHKFLQGLSREEFISRLTSFYGDVNALHPFREFNGRTQRVFFSQLAHNASSHIAWDRLKPEQNISASVASFGGQETLMRMMFDRLIDPWVT
ncbi:Fic/DOC family protein [Acidithrix ferrooxidans]|uniref:protein adenylyltransferase n=1 Tax=Acidithrix ferrooxidans TaxID=1280514 RepID=A0A0D8HFM1_9ACTN|nr:Fic family protein [Acidithrix ferrooxidans]KJF15831.1 adenosine monophosphate-protein transferase VbhT [Acidithrix ferrooxidans]